MDNDSSKDRRMVGMAIDKILSSFSFAAFVVTMMIFMAANFASYVRMQHFLRSVNDIYAECGLPFRFYGQGGFAPVSRIFWVGLVKDYFFACAVSLAVSLAWRCIIATLRPGQSKTSAQGD